MNRSRSVTTPHSVRPLTTGSTPQSPSHMRWAASATVVSGAHMMGPGVITSAICMTRPSVLQGYASGVPPKAKGGLKRPPFGYGRPEGRRLRAAATSDYDERLPATREADVHRRRAVL